jgi:hypothetical protein
MKRRYVGPAEVEANLSGGPAALSEFVKRASHAGDGRVWLASNPECDVVLVIPQSKIDDPDNWDGGVFRADGSVLEIVTDCEGDLDCGQALTEAIFDQYSGQAETGEAHFPVSMMQQPEFGAAMKKANKKVLLSQMSLSSGVGSAECLTVRVPPDESARALNWKQE